MKKDYLEVRSAEGMPNLADGTIALDFLLTAKTAVRNYAIALTETMTPKARTIIHTQLEAAIKMHKDISELMIDKGWLLPYNTEQQFELDMRSSLTAVQIAGMELFPCDTSRLGTFATPEK